MAKIINGFLNQIHALAHTYLRPSHYQMGNVLKCTVIVLIVFKHCTFLLYMVCADEFWTLGIAIAQHSTDASSGVGMRRFRALFGVTPMVCASIWRHAYDSRPEGTSPVHLLWMLLFLKCYGTEAQTRALVHADEKTVRKWVWAWVDVVAQLDVVSNTILTRNLYLLCNIGLDLLGKPVRWRQLR